MTTEEWRPVVGYEEFYEVSSFGNVRSIDRAQVKANGKSYRYHGQTLAPGMGTTGYLLVSLYRNGRNTKKSERVHVLVAAAFLGPRPSGFDVMHSDADELNNRAENLSYGTRAENLRQVISDGHNFAVNKTHCPRGHVLAEPNLLPYQLAKGVRECRSCKRAQYATKGTEGQTFDERADGRYALIMAGA